MNHRRTALVLTLLASTTIIWSSLALAQNKVITIVLPYPAGGPLDISARIQA